MALIKRRYGSSVLVAVALALCTVSSLSFASGEKAEALSLVRSAMDAYSNLDFDGARASLERAQTLAERVDEATLARVYASLGVVWIGGYADNAEGQTSFLIAICIDPKVKVDPLVSTPEIDMMFALASNQAQSGGCSDALSGVTVPGGPPVPISGFPECGMHEGPTQQKKKWEVPLFVEPDQKMLGNLARVLVKYSFDSASNYSELSMRRLGSGYGSLISCNEGQIRVFDPTIIQYYIEGYDRSGALICSTGSLQQPLMVSMLPTAAQLPGYPGLDPQECGECPPWDPTCPKMPLPGLGDPCDEETGCADDLTCAAGYCEADAEPLGPSKFYVQLGGGAGVGYINSTMTIRGFEEGRLVGENEAKVSGMAFSGVPIRLALGFVLSERIAIELTGRFDAKVDEQSEIQKCSEVTIGGNVKCTVADETSADYADGVAYRGDINNPDPVTASEKVYGWAANARVRFTFTPRQLVNFSLFGGVGYGAFKARVESTDAVYFPVSEGFVLELGPTVAFQFHKNVALAIEVPISLVLAKDFMANADFILGLRLGF